MSPSSSSNRRALVLIIDGLVKDAKTIFQVSPSVLSLREKDFLREVKDKARGGTYSYIKDSVFFNLDVFKLRDKEHLRWTVFHEFAHAAYARIFAKQKFFPGTVFYEADLEDDLLEHGIRTMWNGLCDYLVNELVLQRTNVKKSDATTEKTVDGLPESLRIRMCFHLYDYWKHGRDQRVADKSRTKIPSNLLALLDNYLQPIPPYSPANEMVRIFKTVIYEIFKINVETRSLTKKSIEVNAGVALPAFWGLPDTTLEILWVGR